MEALVENEGGRDGSTAGLTQTSQAAQWLPSSEESSLAQTSLKQPEQWLQVTMGQNCKELQSRFGHTERNVFVQFQNPRHIYYVIYSRAIVFAEMLRLYMYIYIYRSILAGTACKQLFCHEPRCRNAVRSLLGQR